MFYPLQEVLYCSYCHCLTITTPLQMFSELLHVQVSNYAVLGAVYLAETLNNFWCSDGGQPHVCGKHFHYGT